MTEINLLILKINGVDVCHMSYNEAVKIFLKSSEPIVFEVCRRRNFTFVEDEEQFQKYLDSKIANLNICNEKIAIKSPITNGSLQLKEKSNLPENSTPTKMTSPSIEKEFMLKFSPITLLNANKNSYRHSSTKSTQTLYKSLELSERLVRNNIFERCSEPEIDLEEITLSKSHGNDFFGIKLCYGICSGNHGSDNNLDLCGLCDKSCAQVFVNDIGPNSIAERDGRLRQGDQILQINGKNLKSKKEYELIMAENKDAITLLISRYLYNDDDYNDVADLDVDDEGDDEECFEENNLSYENCLIANNYINNVVEHFDKTILAQPISSMLSSVDVNSVSNEIVTNKNHANNCCHSVHSSCDTARKGEKTCDDFSTTFRQIKEKSNKTNNSGSGVIKNIDYDTEHIYETIPEDSESEPIYCSPYESLSYVTIGSQIPVSHDVFQLHQKKQRVAQWLGLNPIPPSSTSTTVAFRHSVRSSSGCGRSLDYYDDSIILEHITSEAVDNKAVDLNSKSGQVNLLNSNHNLAVENDEPDNSSSAYNTGDSNNGVSRLTLVLEESVLCEQIGVFQEGHKDEPGIEKTHKLESPKEKITKKNWNPWSKGDVSTNIQKVINETAKTSENIGKGHIQSTLKESNINLHQSMLMQQELIRKALTNQQLQISYTEQFHMPCSHFTAPNLSQYHFVSSREGFIATRSTSSQISNAAVKVFSHSVEKPMVWKVKRRQDGTRYIVRRPARNPFIPVRSSHLNTRNNTPNSTADDPLSEIKVGRHCSKEDRKKHIGKTSERRHQYYQHYLENGIKSAYFHPNQQKKFYSNSEINQRLKKSSQNIHMKPVLTSKPSMDILNLQSFSTVDSIHFNSTNTMNSINVTPIMSTFAEDSVLSECNKAINTSNEISKASEVPFTNT